MSLTVNSYASWSVVHIEVRLHRKWGNPIRQIG